MNHLASAAVVLRLEEASYCAAPASNASMSSWPAPAKTGALQTLLHTACFIFVWKVNSALQFTVKFCFTVISQSALISIVNTTFPIYCQIPFSMYFPHCHTQSASVLHLYRSQFLNFDVKSMLSIHGTVGLDASPL